MPAEVVVPAAPLMAFLLVLARVSGVFIFVPLPGLASTAAMPRILLAMAITLALLPSWPAVDPGTVTAGAMVAWVAAEAFLGIACGVVVSFLNESLVLAAQVLGLQAGYSYASTVDPTTQADSSILQILAQLFASLLFFAIGMDRHLVRAFAHSLETIPPGSWVATMRTADQIVSAGAAMMMTGLRLALPVVALLVLVDTALALLGRINAQLQLMLLAFPVKMLATMLMLAALAALTPAVYQKAAERTLRALAAVAGAPAVASGGS